MAKPIVYIKAPLSISFDDLQKVRQSLEVQLNDYHVLITHGNVEEPTLEVFYEKDFTEVQYEELKKIITDSCKTVVS